MYERPRCGPTVVTSYVQTKFPNTVGYGCLATSYAGAGTVDCTSCTLAKGHAPAGEVAGRSPNPGLRCASDGRELVSSGEGVRCGSADVDAGDSRPVVATKCVIVVAIGENTRPYENFPIQGQILDIEGSQREWSINVICASELETLTSATTWGNTEGIWDLNVTTYCGAIRIH